MTALPNFYKTTAQPQSTPDDVLRTWEQETTARTTKLQVIALRAILFLLASLNLIAAHWFGFMIIRVNVLPEQEIYAASAWSLIITATTVTVTMAIYKLIPHITNKEKGTWSTQ